MSISQKLEISYKNQIENIKNEKNRESKIRQIDALVMDVGEKTINAISKLCGFSWRFVKYCYTVVKEHLQRVYSKNKCGNKKIEEKHPEIINQIKEICENTENVDKSLRDDTVYVDVSAGYVRKKLITNYGYSENDCPCENTIIRIFKEKLGYKITKVKKNKVIKKIPETDAIFDNVNKKKEEVKHSGNNVVAYSIDDKTAKLIGNLSDNGYSWKERNALDHDTTPKYRTKPFGVCNIKTNEVTVYCTTSKSTAKFKVDCLENQIKRDKSINPNINKVYLFLDNGPENSSHRTLWMLSLIQLSIKLNVTIELVYYPPYHSKYNLIEHFWGVLQRSWNGLIIDSLLKLIGAINGTKWNKINAKGILVKKEYKNGETVDKEELKILIDKHVTYPTKGIEKWSPVITP